MRRRRGNLLDGTGRNRETGRVVRIGEIDRRVSSLVIAARIVVERKPEIGFRRDVNVREPDALRTRGVHLERRFDDQC